MSVRSLQTSTLRHKQRSLTYGIAAAGDEQQQPQSEAESLHDAVSKTMRKMTMMLFFVAVIDSEQCVRYKSCPLWNWNVCDVSLSIQNESMRHQGRFPLHLLGFPLRRNIQTTAVVSFGEGSYTYSTDHSIISKIKIIYCHRKEKSLCSIYLQNLMYILLVERSS